MLSAAVSAKKDEKVVKVVSKPGAKKVTESATQRPAGVARPKVRPECAEWPCVALWFILRGGMVAL